MKFYSIRPLAFLFIVLLNNMMYSQWQQQTSPTGSKLEALYFIDANVGFTSSSFVSQMYKTTNGGQTWSAIGNYPSRDIHFVDATNGFASSAAGSPNGTMKKTTNGGTTWSQITPPNSSAYLGVYATSASSVYFINTEDKVIRSTNGGTSVSSYTLTLSNPGSQSLTDIHFPTATTGFVSAEGGQLFRTTNSGALWSSLTTNTTSTLNSIYFVNSTLGYVAGSGGRVLKTTDGGTTWVDKSIGVSSFITAIKFYDATNGLAVCYSGKIYRTSNGGDSWIQQVSGTTNHLYNVFYLSATSAVIVGDGGTILKNVNVLSNAENVQDNSTITLFPNPANDVLQIQSNDDVVISAISIYNTLGQLIKVIPNAKETTSIDVSQLVSGTYFVKVTSDKGSSNSKFIKE